MGETMKKHNFGLLILFIIFSICQGTMFSSYCGGTVACSCGDTLTSSRNLTDDDFLRGCPAEGLIINANGITLNCKGSVISGDDSGNESGIYIEDNSRITIENCEITNFHDGINFNHSSNNTIFNNSLHSNTGKGIRIYIGLNNFLMNNIVSSNWEAGIHLKSSHYTILMNNTVLTNNIASSEGEAGIYLYVCHNSTLENNTASNNMYSGIRLDACANAVLFNNTANSNEEYGIEEYAGINNSLTRNTVNENRLNGFFSGNSGSSGEFRNNTALSNGQSGISIVRGSNYTIVQNTACSNGANGISFSYGTDNNVSNNTALSNSRNGIAVGDGRNNFITNNTLQENAQTDLLVSASLSTYCLNTITNNNGSGGRNIIYYNSSTSLTGAHISELILCNADYSNITNVKVDGSGSLNNNGIFVIKTNNAQIVNSSSSRNYYGIKISEGLNVNISNNTLNSNGEHGLSLEACSGSYFINNSFNSNAGRGAYVSSNSHNNSFMENTANSNEDEGIRIHSSPNNTFINNTANSNDYGIYLDSSINNTFISNTANFNSHGVYIKQRSYDNLFLNNTMIENVNYGIYFYRTTSTNNSFLSNNLCTNLGDYDGFDVDNNTWSLNSCDAGRLSIADQPLKTACDYTCAGDPISAECSDSDFGISPLEYGHVDYMGFEIGHRIDDWCLTDTILVEATCDTPMHEYYINCVDYGMICKEGACRNKVIPIPPKQEKVAVSIKDFIPSGSPFSKEWEEEKGSERESEEENQETPKPEIIKQTASIKPQKNYVIAIVEDEIEEIEEQEESKKHTIKKVSVKSVSAGK